MERLRHLHRNVGTSMALRVGFVAIVFVVIGVLMLVREKDPLALVCLLAGAVVPFVLRARIVDDPGPSARMLGRLGFGIVAGSVVGSFARDSLPEQVILGLGAALVGAYVSFFWVLWSDPTVARRE